MLVASKLRWRTAFTYAILIFLLMLSFSVLLAMRFEHWSQTTRSVEWSTYAGNLAAQPTIRTALQADWQAPTPLGRRTQGTLATPTAVDPLHVLSTELKAQATLFNLHLSLFRADGTLIADSSVALDAADIQGAEQLELLPSAPFQAVLYDERLRQTVDSLIVPILADLDSAASAPIGYLRVRVPQPKERDTIALLRFLVLPITLSAAVLIIAMMIIQAETSAYTLRRLTVAANQITQGNLSARTLSLSGGEIGQLARAFNRMADKLQRQMTKRAREKDRLQTMLHIMTDGVLLLNRHGSVRMLNEAAANLFNTSIDRALKRSFVQTVRNHRIVEVLRRCQSSGQTETAILELDNGVVMRMIVTPFLRGRDRGHLVVLQDLTRLYQLQTTRQDFISNISHELRTPLAALRALTETLIDGAIDDREAAVRFLHHMDVEVDALTQMVQELLQLSLIESGKAPLEREVVSASVLVHQGAERLRTQAERAGITFIIDVPTTLPRVSVDPGRVGQVLTNLIHNAVKFTPPDGTICVTAQYNAAVAAEFVTIKVSDTGVGIAHDDLPRIFERFFKADRARSTGGTGLGLAIVKHIVQAHGGTIWAESAPSKGSSFSFTLPVASAPTPLEPTPSTSIPTDQIVNRSFTDESV